MTVTDVETTASRVAVEPNESFTPFAPGTRVEVRSSFDHGWSSGFEVLEQTEAGYRLLRLSDGSALPGTFARDALRRERRRGQWWY